MCASRAYSTRSNDCTYSATLNMKSRAELKMINFRALAFGAVYITKAHILVNTIDTPVEVTGDCFE